MPSQPRAMPSQPQMPIMAPVNENGRLSPGYGFVAPVKDEGTEEWYRKRRFLQMAFTVGMGLAFAPTVILCLKLAYDGDVAFWIGEWGYLAFLVPLIIGLQHGLHAWMLSEPGRLRRYIFLWAPVICSIIFMVVGGIYYSLGRYYHGQLRADECSESGTDTAKFWLQDAYNQAHEVYDQCHQRLSQESNGFSLGRQPSLQVCKEWHDFLDNAKMNGQRSWVPYPMGGRKVLRALSQQNYVTEWKYLAWMEVEHTCGGFCTTGPSLFTSYDLMGRQGGKCAPFVGFKFIGVYQQAFMVFLIGLAIFVLTIVFYMASIPVLSSLGYKGNMTRMVLSSMG